MENDETTSEEIIGDITITLGPDREAVVSYLTSGGVVLSLEDPHTVAIVEMTRVGAEELRRALKPRG